MNQPDLKHCFGCSVEYPPNALFLCLLSVDCIAHVGPMCRGCLSAHQITRHDTATPLASTPPCLN